MKEIYLGVVDLKLFHKCVSDIMNDAGDSSEEYLAAKNYERIGRKMEMKRILSGVLVFLLVLLLMPTVSTNVQAASSRGTTGSCTWSLDGTVLTISGSGAMGTYAYQTYSYGTSFYRWRVKETPWGTNVTDVIIMPGVTKIGAGAFNNCKKLTSVSIADSVKTIGANAFYNCSGLKTITIPDSVQEIGYAAFSGCGSLEEMTIPFVGEKQTPVFDERREARDVLFGFIFGEDAYIGGVATSQCFTIYTEDQTIDTERKYITYEYDIIKPNGSSWGTKDQGYDFFTTLHYEADDYIVKESVLQNSDLIDVWKSMTDYVIVKYSYQSCGSLVNSTGGIYYTEGYPKDEYRQTFYIPAKLKKVTVTNAKRLYFGAFSFCGSIDEIYVPKADTKISINAFYGCLSELVDLWEYDSTQIYCEKGSALESYILAGKRRLDPGHVFNGTNSGSGIRWNSTTPGKGKYIAPGKPTISKVTDESITVDAVDGMEYSLDGINWTDNNVFTKLNPNTEYHVYQRHSEVSRSHATGKAVVLASDPSESVTVSTKPALSGISMTSLPSKLSYLEAKDSLRVSGGILRLEYGTEQFEEINLTADMVLGFDNTKTGTQTLTVTYKGFKTTYDVVVVPKSVSSISVSTKPVKIAYLERQEKLNVSGGKLQISYNNGTREIIDLTESMVSGFDGTKLGGQTLTVTYGGKTCTFMVCVISGNPEANNHDYDNICDAVCNICGTVRNDNHDYDNANDLTCNVCKESLTPSAPKVKSYTADSITLVAVVGLEYRIGNGAWQSSNVFTGLKSGTEYSIYQRVAASGTAKVSESSSALSAYTQTASPSVISKTDTSITIEVPNSDYKFNIDGVNWKSSSNSTYTFGDLTPGTTYTVYQKNGSAPASTLKVTTYRHITISYNPNGGTGAPASQTKIENTPLTLSAKEPVRSGYTFMGWATTSYGAVAYQPGGEYTKDTALTLYAIWAISCTTCGGDGDIATKCSNCNGSGSISYSDKGCPSCSSTSITQYVTGYSGSYYQCRWCGYTFYSPITVTDSRSCSDCSGSGTNGEACSACDAKGWIKDVQKTAPAPTLQSKDYVSVTLKKLEGVEYSMDGTTWQSSNVFRRLDPGTKYRFYQRYQETATHTATKAGAALTVTTNTIPAGSVTLKKVNGQWKYYVGSTFVPITTVVSFSGSRYYVEDGLVPTGFTGWKDYKSQRLYLKSGKLVSNGLYKIDGSWYYIKNGAVASNVTSLVKYNNEWFYVKDGKVASDTTTLVKLNGEWFYVVKGKVAAKTTTLIKYNGEWWYVFKGKIAGQTTTLIKYNNEWFYVIKGKVAGNTTTLIKYNGGWYYIVKGKLAAKTTTLVKYSGKWFYVENGRVNFSKTGLVSWNGSLHYIEKGVKSGKTIFVSHNGKKYYVKSGIAQTGVSGKVSYGGKTYYLSKGVLTDCHSAGHSFTAATCTKPKICQKCTVTNGKPNGHSLNQPTCTQGSTCRDCGVVGNKALGHDYSGSYCKRCGLVSGVYIQIPQLPHTSNYYVNGEVYQTCEITDLSFEYRYTSEGYRHYYIIIKGNCTDHKNGNNYNSKMAIGYKLYDSEGILIDSDYFYTDDIAVGDKFSQRTYLWTGLEYGESYTLVLYDRK